MPPNATVDRILKSPSPPSGAPGTVLFETERLLIRRYLDSDAQGLADLANHEAITVTTRDRFPFPYTLADAEEFLAKAAQPVETGYPGAMCVCLKPHTPANQSSEEIPIGGLVTDPKDDVHYRTWEIGYFFTPAQWNKGYATEAARALIDWVFATWPRLNRLEARAYGPNKKSHNVLRKSGFEYEGTSRGRIEKRGVLLDEVIFGLLREDYDASKRAA